VYIYVGWGKIGDFFHSCPDFEIPEPSYCFLTNLNKACREGIHVVDSDIRCKCGVFRYKLIAYPHSPGSAEVVGFPIEELPRMEIINLPARGR